MTPRTGNATKGISAVAFAEIGSVIHQMAIQAVTASDSLRDGIERGDADEEEKQRAGGGSGDQADRLA